MTRHISLDDLSTLSTARILITGADGMLGRAFAEALRLHVPSATVAAYPHEHLDVTNRERVLGLADTEPDVILHCAGMTNADACEKHPELARRSHVHGTSHVVELARVTGARFFYPQSVFIFDGADLPVTESTTPNPKFQYGRVKLEAESVARERLSDPLIVRMAGFFGGDDKDKNFVGQFTRQVEMLLREGVDEIAVGDRVWQPTYTLDLAANVLLLFALGKSGTYHMGSVGEASFFEVATASVESLGLADQVAVRPAPAARFAADESARRPLRMVTANDRLVSEGVDRQRPWRQSLDDYLQRPYFARLRNAATG